MNRVRAVAACATVALLAAGCGGTSSDGTGGDTFTLALKSDPGLLDPAQVRNTVTYTALSAAYDTLVNIGADGRVVSGLAEKWEVRPSAVIFTLRKGVTCSDGSAVTPRTIVDNVEHVTDPKTKSPTYGVLVPEGMKAKADEAAGTVTLSTPEPFPFILESTRYMYMVCGKGLKDPKVLANETSGSGPYQLASARPNDRYTFTKRKGYAWGPGGATTADPKMPQNLVLRVVASEPTIVNLMVSRELNGALLYGPDRARVAASPGIKATPQPNGTNELFFHQGKDHPGSDPAVRKALVQGVDLKQLGAVSTGGTGKAATGLVLEPRPCQGDTVSGNQPGFDPAAAEAALDAAGWRKGPDGIRAKDGRRLTLRMIYGASSGETVAAGAEFMGQAWRKIGVDVKLRAVSDAAYVEVQEVAQDWDVSWESIVVSLPTQLTGMLAGPPTPKGINFAHLDNAEYRKQVAEAGEQPGPAGCERWKRAESALIAANDVVPVGEKTVTVAARGATFRIPAGLLDPTSIRMIGGA